jgi:hypothetical protein
MTLKLSGLPAFAFFIILFTCSGQSKGPDEPSFNLSLTGTCGNGTDYRYFLNRAGDSGVVIVNGREQPLGWTDFRRIKSAIITYALELTEASYGAPRDSADFTGELALSGLDRTTIIRLNAALTIGTLENGPMTGLLRLLMKQVDDTLRLQQISIPEPPKKKIKKRVSN